MKYVDREMLFKRPDWYKSDDAKEVQFAIWQFIEQPEEKMRQSRFDNPNLELIRRSFKSLVIDDLHRVFHGKCAFCEKNTETSSVHIHRFRPSKNAEPVYKKNTSHLYYYWLEFSWRNLYYVCRKCYPKNDKYFPVAGRRRGSFPSKSSVKGIINLNETIIPEDVKDERPVLIDPCNDQRMWSYFDFFPDGTVVGKNRRGIETIKHFSLDRDSLVRSRREAFQRQFSVIADLLEQENPQNFSEILIDIAGEHRGAWEILLRKTLKIALGRRYVSGDFQASLTKLGRNSDGSWKFSKAVDELTASRQLINSNVGLEKPHTAYFGPVPAELIDIRIRNFKSIEDLKMSMPSNDGPKPESAPCLMILGENASGKSTILEALVISLLDPEQFALLGLEKKSLILDPEIIGDKNLPKTINNRSSIEISYKINDEVYEWNSTIRHDNHTSVNHIEKNGVHNPIIPIFAYGAFRQYLDGEKNYSRHKHVRSLFQSDIPLSNPEKWLAKLSEDDFSMVARALRAVLSVDGDFDILERSDKQVFILGHVSGGSGRNGNFRTPLSIVSSGFRSVLAMLCDVLQGLMDPRVNPDFETFETARGLVLIDEIEAHLHPRWKLAIMTGLRQALPNMNFIATSHDPLCLRGMREGEVIVLQRVAGHEYGSDLPVFTEAVFDLPNNQNWTIEQLLTDDFFQLQSTQSPAEQRRRAEIEDKLARGIAPNDDADVQKYLKSFSETLPIGDDETHRIVQEAIADYLRQRRKKTHEQLSNLRDETKAAIRRALEAEN